MQPGSVWGPWRVISAQSQGSSRPVSALARLMDDGQPGLEPMPCCLDSVATFILESVEKAAMSLGKETVTPRLSLLLNNSLLHSGAFRCPFTGQTIIFTTAPF